MHKLRSFTFLFFIKRVELYSERYTTILLYIFTVYTILYISDAYDRQTICYSDREFHPLFDRRNISLYICMYIHINTAYVCIDIQLYIFADRTVFGRMNVQLYFLLLALVEKRMLLYVLLICEKCYLRCNNNRRACLILRNRSSFVNRSRVTLAQNLT